MNEILSDYSPTRWFSEGGLTVPRREEHEQKPSHGERKWRNKAKSISLTLLAASAIAATSLSLSQAATASNAQEILPPKGISLISTAPGPGATLGEINDSFNELFAAFRGGMGLITNSKTRDLAVKAAARRNIRPEGWARKIASDVGDADD